MKRFAWLVAYSVPAAIGGLLLGAILVGLGIGLYALLTSETTFSNFAAMWSLGLLMTMFAVMFGLLPVLFFGAPAYALLVHIGRASYFTAAIVGCVPGLVLLAFKPDYGWLFLLFGVPVAGIAHFLAKRSTPLQRLGANNSFKPTPLRGAA